MSKINDLLIEAQTKLVAVTTPVDLRNRVVIVYNDDDLLDTLKTIKSYPAIGVIYEGMRSMSETGPTEKKGISAEAVIALVLIEQGDSIHKAAQKQTRAIDVLESMRGAFMGQRSITMHRWHFLVEAPAELKAGMVVWVQRWSVPIQLPPTH